MSDNRALLEAIPTGRENAIHQKVLAAKLGLKPERVKKLIQNARHDGHSICSGSEGYWIAKNEDEMQRFLSSMKNQAIKRFETTKAMRESLKEYKGQISLSDTLTGVSEEVDGDEQG